MLAIYRCLLRLYPAIDRYEYGDEMMDVLRKAHAANREKGALVRFFFFTHECFGLFSGAAHERIRSWVGSRNWAPFASRRFAMRSGFRYPTATIVLMAVIFAAVIVAIEKATSVSASMLHVNPHNVIKPYSLPQTIALLFGITYALGVIGWAILFALRRSGAQRLFDTEIWPQPK
jgi:hypothetical protein